MSQPKIAQKSPYMIEVSTGEKKAWCSCGYSSKQPFCDGSHAREKTGLSPMICEMAKTGKVYFCGCKQTKNPPYCDGTHSSLS